MSSSYEARFRVTRMSLFSRQETITVTPLRAFPVVRDLVTDVTFNYAKAREIPAFVPPRDVKAGDYRMRQVDVERSQEFRKCIECFRCQDTCHVALKERVVDRAYDPLVWLGNKIRRRQGP